MTDFSPPPGASSGSKRGYLQITNWNSYQKHIYGILSIGTVNCV